jgi:hypothetical protein
VRRLFGRQVIDHGAAGDDLPSLLDALDQMEAEGRASDADQDGWGDIEELRQLTDPNDFYDPPYPPDPSPTAGSGGTTSTSDGSGGSAGAGDPPREP